MLQNGVVNQVGHECLPGSLWLMLCQRIKPHIWFGAQRICRPIDMLVTLASLVFHHPRTAHRSIVEDVCLLASSWSEIYGWLWLDILDLLVLKLSQNFDLFFWPSLRSIPGPIGNHLVLALFYRLFLLIVCFLVNVETERLGIHGILSK